MRTVTAAVWLKVFVMCVKTSLLGKTVTGTYSSPLRTIPLSVLAEIDRNTKIWIENL